MDPAEAASQWYVMLFPSEQEGRALVASLQDLAVRTGGTPAPSPHVTIGYFHGAAPPRAVVDRLRPLTGPAIPVDAAGLFSWSERPHPLFGYTLSLRVRRDERVRGWQRAVRAALEPLALASTFAWEDQQPHLQVLRRLPAPPGEALRRLGDH